MSEQSMKIYLKIEKTDSYLLLLANKRLFLTKSGRSLGLLVAQMAEILTIFLLAIDRERHLQIGSKTLPID
jgi:hypothetical protein